MSLEAAGLIGEIDGGGCAHLREAADGGGFAAGVDDPFRGEGLLDFEDGVDAFSRDVGLTFVMEEERGVEAIIDGDIDLAAQRRWSAQRRRWRRGWRASGPGRAGRVDGD